MTLGIVWLELDDLAKMVDGSVKLVVGSKRGRQIAVCLRMVAFDLECLPIRANSLGQLALRLKRYAPVVVRVRIVRPVLEDLMIDLWGFSATRISLSDGGVGRSRARAGQGLRRDQ